MCLPTQTTHHCRRWHKDFKDSVSTGSAGAEATVARTLHQFRNLGCVQLSPYILAGTAPRLHYAMPTVPPKPLVCSSVAHLHLCNPAMHRSHKHLGIMHQQWRSSTKAIRGIVNDFPKRASRFTAHMLSEALWSKSSLTCSTYRARCMKFLTGHQMLSQMQLQGKKRVSHPTSTGSPCPEPIDRHTIFVAVGVLQRFQNTHDL